MEKPKPSLFFFGKNIFEVILEEIKNIPYFDLENVLNNISYSYFQKLVYYFEHYIRKNIEIELYSIFKSLKTNSQKLRADINKKKLDDKINNKFGKAIINIQMDLNQVHFIMMLTVIIHK